MTLPRHYYVVLSDEPDVDDVDESEELQAAVDCWADSNDFDGCEIKYSK